MALAAAVERYEIHHPVLDDPELETWKAYTARAWPTLVVIDPEGYIVAHLSGEGHADGLSVLIPELIAEHEAKGTLHRGNGPYVAPEPTSGTLRFPGKALFLPAGRGTAAGEPAGAEPRDARAPGWSRTPATTAWWSWTLTSTPCCAPTAPGPRATPTAPAPTSTPSSPAQFNEPQGLVLLPEDVAAKTGYDVVIADTVNHRLRGLSLADGTVTTLVGNGVQRLLETGPARVDEDAAGFDRAARATIPWTLR